MKSSGYHRPDFLCIGAQKAATTWLHYALSQHPNIWLPPVKELHYFDQLESTKKPEYWRKRRLRSLAEFCENQISLPHEELADADTFEWMSRFSLSKAHDDAWYQSLFPHGNKHMKRGEITPAYATLSKKTVEYVHERYPDLKILFLMRDPLERSLSGLKEKYQSKPKKLRRMDPDQLINLLNKSDHELRSNYIRTIEIWESFYPSNQIQYYFYDDIKKSPSNFLDSVFDFLEVDQKFSKKIARSARPENVSFKIEFDRSVYCHLAEKYKEQAEWLRDRFGGCTTQWHQNLMRVLADSA